MMFLGAKIYIELECSTPIVLNDYTAKIVKTILVKGNSSIKRVFTKKQNPRKPKPVCISPLLLNGRPIYPHSFNREPIKPVKLSPGIYSFYVGAEEKIWHMVEDAIAQIDKSSILLGKKKVDLSVKRVVLERVFPPQSFELKDRYRIIFVGPVFFRDPFVKKAKYKCVVPTPENIFSIQLKLLKYIRNCPSLEVLKALRNYMQIPATYLHFLKPVWFSYKIRGDVKRILGITGSIEIRLSIEDMPPKVHSMIRDIIALAHVIGVGSARAAGFGFIELQ